VAIAVEIPDCQTGILRTAGKFGPNYFLRVLAVGERMGDPEFTVREQPHHVCARRPTELADATGHAVPPELPPGLGVKQDFLAPSVEGHVNDTVTGRIEAEEVTEPVVVGISHERIPRFRAETLRPQKSGGSSEVGRNEREGNPTDQRSYER